MAMNLKKIPNIDTTTWNVFVPENPDLDYSEISEDDIEDIYDDTYSEFIENSDKEIEQSLYNESNEEINSLNTQTAHEIDFEVHKSLINRVHSLQKTVEGLRQLLSEEHRLWRQEREEYDLIREKMNLRALAEATTVAHAATEAYAVESTKGYFPDPSSFGRIACPISKSSNLVSIHQNTSNNDYYQKLNHIERLCNEELQKVQSDAELLEPLKQIVSQWDIDDNLVENSEVQEINANQ